jgi:hypothetical protein
MLERRAGSLSSVRATAAAALLVLGGLAGRAPAQEPAATPSEPGPATPEALLERLGNAWFARDFEGYLALWDFASPELREAEAAAAREAFSSDETQLSVLGRARPVVGSSRMVVGVQVFMSTEPRARVEHWQLSIEHRGRRWAFVEKEAGQGVEGLIHLPLAAEAWRVRDASLRLEDFELLMQSGTLFSSHEAVGPTAFVFVGRGRVRFTPRPVAEREQLRQFADRPQIDRSVKWAFVRLDPADFDEVMDTAHLLPEPDPERRREEALKRWTERTTRSYMVDAPLPSSPWWLYPSRGDALVDFPWKRGHVLTFVTSRNKRENVNLFERDRGLQICSYPSADRPLRRLEAEPGVVDVLHHDLRARFEPSRLQLSAVDTLQLRLRAPAGVIRLKLDDDFQVSSVSSQDGASLLFLRVRDQDSLVVSLGPPALARDELSLSVRYSGRHDPGPVDRELTQLFPEGPGAITVPIDSPLVYSNRTAWYPQQAEGEDFSTLRAYLDTPDGFVAITGGELLSSRTSEGRRRTEYRLREPGKYFTAVVGRFEDVGMRQLGEQAVRGFAAPRTEGETQRRMATAEQMLSFYAGLFGPCPYPVINQVVVEGLTPGGHSPPGLVYVQKRPRLLVRPLAEDPANFSDIPGFFQAHEFAHQWWGQGVAPASYRDQWLSEAWAQYSAALWVRHREGEGAFRKMMSRMARWARRYDEDGPIDLGRRLGHLKRDDRIHRAIVYDKGAWVLHMLRGLLGDAAFFAGARTFLEEHRYGQANTEDLRAALEAAGGGDLEPYFERWIYGTGLPRMRWTSDTQKTPHGYETTVQVQPEDLPGPLPLEVSLETGGDRTIRRVVLEPAGSTWRIRTPDRVHDVRIDESHEILAEWDEVDRLPDRAQR